MHGTRWPLEGLPPIPPEPAFGLGQRSRNLAKIVWVDAEGRLQIEHSQQMPSVRLLISNGDLALAFTSFLGHTGVSKRTFGLWPRAER